ncbi:hypothetical protein BDD12DRAFT_980889 [Trichophaea hybrida]|nr:hypothetical protein BDD12DRAFT_980889 [Trichophaea hybrida]
MGLVPEGEGLGRFVWRMRMQVILVLGMPALGILALGLLCHLTLGILALDLLFHLTLDIFTLGLLRHHHPVYLSLHLAPSSSISNAGHSRSGNSYLGHSRFGHSHSGHSRSGYSHSGYSRSGSVAPSSSSSRAGSVVPSMARSRSWASSVAPVVEIPPYGLEAAIAGAALGSVAEFVESQGGYVESDGYGYDSGLDGSDSTIMLPPHHRGY